MFDWKSFTAGLLIGVALSNQAFGLAIEPRSVQWNILSDSEMSRTCVANGHRPNCEGLAAWNKEFRQCVIWTRSPSKSGWEVVEHELRHCQEGHFHIERHNEEQ